MHIIKGIMIILLLNLSHLNAWFDQKDVFVSKSKVLEHFECHVKSSFDCTYLERGINRDSDSCLVDPAIVEDETQYSLHNIWLKGKIKYLSFYPGKYGYFINNKSGDIKVQTKIHFKNLDKFSDVEIADFETKMNQAASRWSYSNARPFPIKFEVKVARKSSEAHVNNVNLTHKPSRGPYFSTWSTSWSVETISHEFGHLFGLDDEYENRPFGGGTGKCDTDSLMCNSLGGSQHPYHYYLILRRAFCSKR